MIFRSRSISVQVLLALLIGGPLGAQSTVAFWTGYSFDAGGPFSRVQTLDFVALGAEIRNSIGSHGLLQVERIIGLVPVALVLRNATGEVFPFGDGWGLRGNLQRVTTYGAGVMPLGLRITASPSGRLGGYVMGALGAILFTRGVPAGNTFPLNLVVEGGFGLRGRLTERVDVEAGYKLHHLSNAGLGDANPGLDSKVFLVGLAISR